MYYGANDAFMGVRIGEFKLMSRTRSFGNDILPRLSPFQGTSRNDVPGTTMC
jgi:hypothetical protein